MAKSDEVMGGMVGAAKAAATGIPAAVAVDVMIGAYAPADMTPMTRDVIRAAGGAALTLGALVMGAPTAWAAGPLVANTAVAAVEGSRRAGWAQKLRDAMARTPGR